MCLYFYHVTNTTAVMNFVGRVNQKKADFGMRMAPPLRNIPFPIPDQKRPWGSEDCTECQSVCSGHFLSPEDNIQHVAKHGTGDCQFSPPSEVIKSAFGKRARQGQLMDENTILTLAKTTLLSKEEVQMWVDHLSCLAKHRQAGAKKAAKSRAKKGTSYSLNL